MNNSGPITYEKRSHQIEDSLFIVLVSYNLPESCWLHVGGIACHTCKKIKTIAVGFRQTRPNIIEAATIGISIIACSSFKANIQSSSVYRFD